MTLAAVETIYEANSRDIPTMLREMADRIEKDGETKDVVLVEDYHDGSIAFYGWGDLTASDAYVSLGRAQLEMILNGYG